MSILPDFMSAVPKKARRGSWVTWDWGSDGCGCELPSDLVAGT